MLMTDAAFQLTISAVGLATMVYTTNSAIDDALAMGTGQYMQNVAQVVNTYVFDNMTVLAASPTTPTSIQAGSVTATVPKPLQPTIQDLVNLQLLPIGFSDKSPLGISFTINLTPTNCASGLTNCTIPGQMYSTAGYRDATGNIRSDLMAAAVQMAGVDGGASYAENPALITGMAASWSAANPLPGTPAGVLMMRVGNTSLLAQSMNQFYKRDGSLNLTGPMDANNQAMNRVGNFQSNGSVSAAGNVAASGNVTGNLVAANGLQSYGNASIAGIVGAAQVNASAIQSYGNVRANGSVVTDGYIYAAGALVPSTGTSQQVFDGQACGDPQGSIRSDASGKILSCQSGVWKAASGGGMGIHSMTWQYGGSGAANSYPMLCYYKAGSPGIYQGAGAYSTDNRAGSVADAFSPFGDRGYRQTDGYACPPGTAWVQAFPIIQDGGGNGG
ncbi:MULTISPECIES: adhesin [unclassified Cupriavidus]|uniref:adhesin n=1 Tax=unclassified Cupriavidus TaxID=2640874 RepID=UPI0010F8B20D|nr:MULTISPECIES: adhesin [unclassified Cupriavidus]MWL92052.1 adhesin [Cupriavidus sp. SW-Y-13]